MPAQRKAPSDYTGRQREKLEKEHAEVIQTRQAEMAMATAAKAVAEADEVINLVKEPPKTEEGPDGTVVYVEPPARTIRVNATIEQMTFGVGNTYDFYEGRQYTVPAAVADHLEELGYVWH